MKTYRFQLVKFTLQEQLLSLNLFQTKLASNAFDWGHLLIVSVISSLNVKSVQSALSDLLTTSATHGTFSHPSTKRGLILIGLELNTNARESFEHCWSYSLNLSIDQHVCQFIS